MAIPDRVPIQRERGYRTSHIGRYDGGQFFASVTATHEPGGGADPYRPGNKRWYAVLHRFDPDGAHAGSEIWFAGTSEHERTSIKRADTRLKELIATLPSHKFGDIAIKLFHVELDGHVFGLVDQSDTYGDDHAE